MKAKVRGIYATAITALLLKQGIIIVQPTPPIQKRFNLPPLQLQEEVYIHDLPDKQGVAVEGLRGEEMVDILRDLLPEAVFRTTSAIPRLDQLSGLKLSFEQFKKLARRHEIEFPYQVKTKLDEIRREVIPTINEHHLLKIIDSVSVDMAEAELKDHPEQAEGIWRCLKERLVYQRYRKDDELLIQHVKLDGSTITIRGMIEEVGYGRVVLRRRFKGGGSYNGLGLAKEEGDWGIIELEEGSWFHWRRYFSSKGEIKGELYNINTPIEFYSGFARYIDLEVDVVLVDKEARVIDRERVEREAERGTITHQLKERALKIAEEVMERLSFKG